MSEEEVQMHLQIKKTVKALGCLYAIVWIEIAVLAFIIVMMAWTLLYAMDSLKSIADDNARIFVELQQP